MAYLELPQTTFEKEIGEKKSIWSIPINSTLTTTGSFQTESTATSKEPSPEPSKKDKQYSHGGQVSNTVMQSSKQQQGYILFIIL